MYIVFSQEPLALPDAERLASQAARFFASKLELLGKDGSHLRLRLANQQLLLDDEFVIRVRPCLREDWMEARDAEARGSAAGMAALAEKCTAVWEIAPGGEDEPSEASYLTLSAICASVALGPVLPPDRSTLFGVRGAIERRDKLA
jgi:hypothetical protein